MTVNFCFLKTAIFKVLISNEVYIFQIILEIQHNKSQKWECIKALDFSNLVYFMYIYIFILVYFIYIYRYKICLHSRAVYYKHFVLSFLFKAITSDDLKDE